jgi:DNA (cytosine-5)-methyltransferase 1
MGYMQARFTLVVGVDIAPQPNYRGNMFYQMDAIDFLTRMDISDFDLVHASPPCQHYAAVTRWRGNAADHPDLVDPTRRALKATNLPYVIENVREAELREPTMLCGSQFGLKVRRHRYFESDWLPFQFMPSCFHGGLRPFEHKQERAYADAMGCHWMTNTEAREAIPPAYTKFIGEQFLAQPRVLNSGEPACELVERELT